MVERANGKNENKGNYDLEKIGGLSQPVKNSQHESIASEAHIVVELLKNQLQIKKKRIFRLWRI